MIQKLAIHGFRCFRELHVEPLTRVNLFVGQNNAGKTSLLEAVELVANGRIEGLVQSAVRRKETILAGSEIGEEFKEYVVDPSHLFFGHDLQPRNLFLIETGGLSPEAVQCTVDPHSEKGTSFWSLRFKGSRSSRDGSLTISPAGGVRPLSQRLLEPKPRVNFLRAESPDRDQLGKLWDALVLTPEEEEVTAALQLIEPRIERLAVLRDAKIFLKLSGVERPVPLGNLGGGIEHLLALVLHLFSARGGFLLVDEIDTGLHYSVMVDMWRLIIETAIKLDVQVFATTHSLDCVRALAQLRKQYPEQAAEVTLHRVEKDAATTVVYEADELVVAAESQLEVR